MGLLIMKRHILIIFIFIHITQFCNCIPPNIKNAFIYRYSGTYTGLDTLINIQGYYSQSLLFYNNGILISGFDDFNYKRIEIEESKNISLFFSEVVENDETKEAKFFYNSINCGTYIICGDTIKMQIIHKSYSMNDTWDGWERWCKIIDKNTLQFINYFPITISEKGKRFILQYNPPTFGRYYQFTFLPTIPKPDKFWILKEKWFWCNEQDWKNYMEKIKGRKKK
jgi:hypothetical protein